MCLCKRTNGFFYSLDSGSAAGMTRKREMAKQTTIVVPGLCLLRRPSYTCGWSHPNSNHSGKSIRVHHKNGFGWYNGNRPHWPQRHWSSAPAHIFDNTVHNFQNNLHFFYNYCRHLRTTNHIFVDQLCNTLRVPDRHSYKYKMENRW